MDHIQHPSGPTSDLASDVTSDLASDVTSDLASDPAAAADSKIQATPPSERRGQRRAKTDLFVNRFLNGHPYLCRMTNISRSGARLVPIIEPRLTPAPSFMGLQFQLPGRPEVVTASGQAVTTDDGRAVGIRFTRLPAAAASAIDALVG